MFGSCQFGAVVFAGEPGVAIAPPPPIPTLTLCQQYAIGVCIGQSNPCDEFDYVGVADRCDGLKALGESNDCDQFDYVGVADRCDGLAVLGQSNRCDPLNLLGVSGGPACVIL